MLMLLMMAACTDSGGDVWQTAEPFEAVRFAASGLDVTFYTVAPGEPASVAGATAEVSGGMLWLDARCDDACGQQPVTVGVRADIDVVGTLDGGDLLLSGLGGVLDVSVSGAIEADQLAAPWAALAATGDITAQWSRPPVDAQLTADGGAIALQVPTGAYALDLVDAKIDGITEDPDAVAFIYARASTGSVQLSGR